PATHYTLHTPLLHTPPPPRTTLFPYTTLFRSSDPPKLNRKLNHTISVIVDRLVVRAADRGRLSDSVETALKLAEGNVEVTRQDEDRKSTRLNSSHRTISYAVFCLKKKNMRFFY